MHKYSPHLDDTYLKADHVHWSPIAKEHLKTGDDDETDRLSAGWKARAWIGQSRGTSSCQVIDPCTVLQPNSVVQCSRYEL